ncbi:MAG: hypothetical protein ACJ8F7_16235 [Gemmataceae bacterium]
MAEMIIMLRRDPQTGKQTITIKLESDPDALPQEHEQMHRALVEKALGRKLEDYEEIIVEREATAEPATPQKNETPPERQKEAQGR